MTPAALLERLGALGVAVSWLGPGRIALAPADRIPDDLRPEVVAHKAELAALLSPPPADPMAGDPRPDLPGSEAWMRLLALAGELDGPDPRGCFGALHGMRCCGAILERHGDGWRLAPTLDPTEQVSIWHDRASWNADADEWLRPHMGRLRALLGALDTAPGSGAPDSRRRPMDCARGG